ASVCLAWIGAAITREGWGVFYETVSREALQRLSPGHSPRPFSILGSLSLPLRIIAATLPWSALALVSLWPGFWRKCDDRQRRLLQFFHCWAWPSMIFWALPSEHNARTSFPLIPGIAGLAIVV